MELKSKELIAHHEADLPGIVRELLLFAEGRIKFALQGDLGAGKTALVKAFCRHFGVQDNVTSPTFSLVNEYQFLDESGRQRTLHHLDLYRLRNLEEAYGIGIEDYLYDENYCLIEWPELVGDLLPPETVFIKISILPDSSRKILFLLA